MEPEQPSMQPINPNPSDPQFVPQPTGSGAAKPKMGKKLWLIIAGVVGFLLVLGVAYWFMARSANEGYKKDAAAYKQSIKEVRDTMDNQLEKEGVSAYDRDAPPIFEEYGKKMQDVVTKAPKKPKVFGFIPVSGVGETEQQVNTLTQAATDYANQLRGIYTFFVYITTTADQFKPIKDTTDVKALPELWEAFLTEFKTLTPSPDMESTHEELTRQAETILTDLTAFVGGFDQRTTAENSAIAQDLTQTIATFNKTFQEAVQETTEQALDKVNQYYDELDKLLQ